MRTHLLLLLICLFLPLAVAEEFSGLVQHKEKLAKLVKLGMKEGKLYLDYSHWDEVGLGEVTDDAIRRRLVDRMAVKTKADLGSITDDSLKKWVEENKREAGCIIQFLTLMHSFKGGRRIWGKSNDLQCTTLTFGDLSVKGNIAFSNERTKIAIEEKTGIQRSFYVCEEGPLGFLLRFEEKKSQIVTFMQSPDGLATVTFAEGDNIISFAGKNFSDLLRKHPAEMQVKFLRTLASIGIELPLHPLLPPVMATSTTGFGEGAAEHRARAAALIKQLGDEEATKRDEATTALIRHYPFAVRQIREAAEKSEDAEVKMRLKKVIAAHPTIEKALAFVEEKKLHEDKAYLLDLLANVPFFKASARARLAELYGKDHGDDAAQWPKP